MSRAVLRVVRCGSTSPAFSRHLSATDRARAVSAAKVLSRYGWWTVRSSAVSPQPTGELRPTPRGSNPIRSNRSRTSAGSSGSISTGIVSPWTPGPPGFISITPCRFAALPARTRDTASSMLRPAGSA